jgi:hypothetical protein
MPGHDDIVLPQRGCRKAHREGRNKEMTNLKKLRMVTGRAVSTGSPNKPRIERTHISMLENGHLKLKPEHKAAIEQALLGAMRENVAQFSRLTGTEIQSL